MKVILLSFRLRTSILLLAISMLSGLTVAAEETGGYAINLSSNDSIGTFMVNETGFTLYYFLNDPGNGNSTCSGECLAAWPAFYAENITVPEGLNASDFADAIRTDDVKQTAYKGWPLYTYIEDTAPGDFKGHGAKEVWLVASPEDFIIIES